jgi:hypothetical protein
MFKWHGDGGVDFREHLQIKNIEGTNEEGKLICQFQKFEEVLLTVKYRFMKELVMSWVSS